MYSSVITEPDSYKPLFLPKLKRGTTNWFLCYSLGIQYSGLSLPTFLGDESYRTHGCTSRELFSCRQPPLLRLLTRLSWNHKKMTSWLPCAASIAGSLCQHQSSTRFFVSFDRKVRPVICKDQYEDRHNVAVVPPSTRNIGPWVAGYVGDSYDVIVTTLVNITM